HKRLPGEVALQKGFVAAHGIFSSADLAGIELRQAVNKAKFRPVGKRSQGLVERVHCFNGSTPLKSGGIGGENTLASSLGFKTAFVKSFRREDPSANRSSLASKDRFFRSKTISIFGIILRAPGDFGSNNRSQTSLVTVC